MRSRFGRKGLAWRLSSFWMPSLLGLSLLVVPAVFAQSGDETPSHQEVAEAARGRTGSPYIPLDSWMYPAAIRLYELGYLPTAYIGLRPWTRVSLAHMLLLSQGAILREDGGNEASEIFDRLHRELAPELQDDQGSVVKAESVYTRLQEISGGPVLNDSYHFGQTVINDYGRPYGRGFSNISGYSADATLGRFDLYARGEYQHAPGNAGYSQTVADYLTGIDRAPHVPQFGVPLGVIPKQDDVRMIEANLSAHAGGHQISFGKADAWLGPAQGSSMAWSNNAENIYSFRINRIEPLYIPGLSRITGLFRYDFFVGSLKGHNFPSDPWIHAEKISFKPTPDLEIGFERSVIWGGKGHVPITVHTFLRSFFSITAVEPAVKFSRSDPGARFSTFDFTWRIPWQDHLATIYMDSLAHDDVFPVSAPGRAGLRPGVYLSRLPLLRRVDLRAEAASTDPPDRNSQLGQFLYFESAQMQGYTNRNQILGDWIGREGKGGQAWLTWHIRADQSLQFEYRTAKAAKDFLPGGTTHQDASVHLLLRPAEDLELKATVQGELWRAPFIASGTQHNVLANVQVTWFPHLQKKLK